MGFCLWNSGLHQWTRSLLSSFLLSPVTQFVKSPVFEVHLSPFLSFLTRRALGSLTPAEGLLFRLWKVILFAHTFSLGVRFAYIAYLFNFYLRSEGEYFLEEYAHLDPILGYISRRTVLLNRLSTPALGCSIPLEFYVDYSITFNLDLQLLLALPLKTLNGGGSGSIKFDKLFHKSLFKIKNKKRKFFNPWILWKNSLSNWFQDLWNPSSTGALALKLDFIFSKVIIILLSLIMFAMGFFLYVLFISSCESGGVSLSTTHLWTVLADGFLAGYALWNTLRIALIGIGYMLLVSVDNWRLLNALEVRLKGSLSKVKGKRSPEELSFSFSSYFRRWVITFRMAIHHNKSLLSQLLFAILGLSSGGSLVMLAMLVYERALAPAERASLLALLFVQVALGAVAVEMAVRMPAKLYTAGGLLARAGMSLGEAAISTSMSFSQKWKLHTLYELVHTDTPFCYTVGPLGRVARSSVQKVRNFDF